VSVTSPPIRALPLILTPVPPFPPAPVIKPLGPISSLKSVLPSHPPVIREQYSRFGAELAGILELMKLFA
jgi:hypothetical protein